MIKTLENKLAALKISGRVYDVKDNTFFTSYYIKFAPDVTIKRIRARREDLELFFDGAGVDIETDGGQIYIKVSKDNRKAATFYDFSVDITGGRLSSYEIPLIIGQTEDGGRLFYDLAKMPHLLIAGATGSGKSVFMHDCILSTLYAGNCNIVLIDVKRVEFSIYEGVPHLCRPIAYDGREALENLKSVCFEMSRRYELLQKENCRNIQEYHERGGCLNYITVFIDELADLVLSNHEIEFYLVKLAQLGRAAGIHLVVATQRPDSTVLSGLIRANIPSRVCFSVQKATDSRIILDMAGGETLRGRGDGLFLPIGSKKPTRFQAPYITPAALEKTIEAARHCND